MKGKFSHFFYHMMMMLIKFDMYISFYIFLILKFDPVDEKWNWITFSLFFFFFWLAAMWTSNPIEILSFSILYLFAFIYSSNILLHSFFSHFFFMTDSIHSPIQNFNTHQHRWSAEKLYSIWLLHWTLHSIRIMISVIAVLKNLAVNQV